MCMNMPAGSQTDQFQGRFLKEVEGLEIYSLKTFFRLMSLPWKVFMCPILKTAWYELICTPMGHHCKCPRQKREDLVFL